MPQLHALSTRSLHQETLAWGRRLAYYYTNCHTIWGGDFQTTTLSAGHKLLTTTIPSHLIPLHTPIPTFPRSGTCIYHWLHRPTSHHSPLPKPHVTHAPSNFSDHSDLTLLVPLSHEGFLRRNDFPASRPTRSTRKHQLLLPLIHAHIHHHIPEKHPRSQHSHYVRTTPTS
jgi:hypothetical protein